MHGWSFSNEYCNDHLLIYQIRLIIFTLFATAITTIIGVSAYRLIRYFKENNYERPTKQLLLCQIAYFIICIIFAICFPVNVFLYCYNYSIAAITTFIALYATYYFHWILLILTYFIRLYELMKQVPSITITRVTTLSFIFALLMIIGMPLIVIFWFISNIAYTISVILCLFVVIILSLILSGKFSYELYANIPRRQSTYNQHHSYEIFAVARKIYTLSLVSVISTLFVMFFSIFIFTSHNNEILWTMWQIMILGDVLINSLCILLALPNSEACYVNCCGSIDNKIEIWCCNKIDYAAITNNDNNTNP